MGKHFHHLCHLGWLEWFELNWLKLSCYSQLQICRKAKDEGKCVCVTHRVLYNLCVCNTARSSRWIPDPGLGIRWDPNSRTGFGTVPPE